MVLGNSTVIKGGSFRSQWPCVQAIGCSSPVRIRRSNPWHISWFPPSLSRQWTRINCIAVGYEYRGCSEDFQSYWSNPLDCDHLLACTNVGAMGPMEPRLDCDKLPDPFSLSIYRNALAQRLHFAHLITSVGTDRFLRMPCILPAYWVMAWLVLLWHSGFLLSLCASVAHTSASGWWRSMARNET